MAQFVALSAFKYIVKSMTPTPTSAPSVNAAGVTEARRSAELKERTETRRRAGFNQTYGAGLSGASNILGG